MQVCEKKEIYDSSKYMTCLDSGANGVKCEAACTRQRRGQDYICSFPSGRTENKNLDFHGSSFPDNAAVRGNNNKRRWTSDVGEYHPPNKRALPRKVNSLPFSNGLVGKNCMQSPSSLLPIVEENIECSVASCSGNDLPEYVQDTRNKKHSRDISGDLFDDTTFSFAPKFGKDYPDVSEDKLAANVHELELHAYKSTVQALHASGPLSWEQESLLTNLRMSLHISNEEHLLQIRNLLSA